MPVNIAAILLSCAPAVHPATAQALIAVESAFNPYAIGIVGGGLQYQPSSFGQAVATAQALRSRGGNFSAGLAQINVKNWKRLGLTEESAFDPCANLRAMQRILLECFGRAARSAGAEQAHLRAALSCYHTGELAAGGRDGYVARVVAAARSLGTGMPDDGNHK